MRPITVSALYFTLSVDTFTAVRQFAYYEHIFLLYISDNAYNVVLFYVLISSLQWKYLGCLWLLYFNMRTTALHTINTSKNSSVNSIFTSETC